MTFRVVPPSGAETPVVVEVPHAGLEIPAHFRPPLIVPARAIGRDADLYVDELYGDAPLEGATLLVAETSRYLLDLNRGEDDVDASTVAGCTFPGSRPRGLLWSLTTDNERVLARPLTQGELEERLNEVHRPYHRKLRALLEDKRARFGYAILLAAHSMPSVGRTAHGDAGARRADVVPGTQGGSTCDARFLEAVERHARGAGFTVLRDDPYRGGYSTKHYGKPASQIHAVQVELARRLYMDESTLRRNERFGPMRMWCRGLVRALGGKL